jgi:hypothetical protein
MPLIHSKKPAAFKKNIRAEVHAGKPVKQAVAIAYSVKRKAEHHKAHGGEMEDCPLCMDDGGQVTNQSGAESFQEGFRKATHYSEGGKVNLDKRISESRSRFPNEENQGVHAESYSRPKQGQSEAGNTYRNVKGVGGGYEERGRAAVKAEHERRLGELQSMPNPKLKGLAEGGEVEDYEGSADDELHDLLGQEIMDAVHYKDHKRLMSGIEAMVLKCMNKGENND